MKVVVGSLNPTKVKGVKRAFNQFFEDVVVKAVKVDSGVDDQPFNNDVVKGAVNRAINSFHDCDFSVGVEAGLFSLKRTLTGYIDFQVAAIYNGNKITVGFGPGFEYPPIVIEEVLKGKEVGDVMDEITGIKNLGEKTGAVYYLTKGVISRDELTRLAVTMALIPWINREMYLL